MPEFREDYYEELAAQYDRLVHAKTTIPVHKRLAHDGMMFEVGAVVGVPRNGGQIAFITDTAPDLLVVSHRLIVSTDRAPVVVSYFEGGIYTGGLVGAAVNRNRATNSPSASVTVTGPTTLTPGSLLRQILVPRATSRSVEATWVLKPSTAYPVVVQNTSLRDTDVEVAFEFFEITYTR